MDPKKYAKALKFSAENYTHTDFTNRIAENPQEHTGSLAFADWLEEQGHSGSADLIKHHIANGFGWGPLDLESGDVNLHHLTAMKARAGLAPDYQGPFAFVRRYGSTPNGPGREPTETSELELYYPHAKGYLRYRGTGPTPAMQEMRSRMTDVPPQPNS